MPYFFTYSIFDYVLQIFNMQKYTLKKSVSLRHIFNIFLKIRKFLPQYHSYKDIVRVMVVLRASFKIFTTVLATDDSLKKSK